MGVGVAGQLGIRVMLSLIQRVETENVTRLYPYLPIMHITATGKTEPLVSRKYRHVIALIVLVSGIFLLSFSVDVLVIEGLVQL